MRGRLVLTAFLLIAALVSSLAASSSPAVATGTCGDTVVDETEQCDDGGTVPGDGCDAQCRVECSTDLDCPTGDGWTCGSNGACEFECSVNCDCPQGQFCFYNKCVLDPKMPVYCCEKSGCPPGSWCLTGDGDRLRCAEDPAHWCDTPCDCGPAHCCNDNKCVKDINDPWTPDGEEVGPACIRGVDATYCATAPTCRGGYGFYMTDEDTSLADFRCQWPTGEVASHCAWHFCYFGGDCQFGESCADVEHHDSSGPHPGKLVGPEPGQCVSNATAEGMYGFKASGLLPPCTYGVPGMTCEAGWRPANTDSGFAIERVVGTNGSCGNNACEFALLETSANCPADCACGDGYCDTSEVGTCTADCGVCDETGCDQTVMPLEWTALSTCGDGVCQKDGEIPEDCVNCWLDCDAETDSDGDGTADGCDGCPNDPGKVEPGTCGCGIADTDSDGDGLLNCLDNCPTVANIEQADMDGDSIGDACDPDVDGDGVTNEDDMCPGTPALGSATTDWLLNNRYAVDANGTFTSANGTDSGDTVSDTAGCDEHQIIDALGLGEGHTKFGLSIGVLEVWIKTVNT